jgi:xylulokinase
MSNYLGIDLGTSSVKVLVCNQQGKIVAEKMKTYGIIFPRNGWHEQNPGDWLAALKDAMKELLSDDSSVLNQIRAISISGQMHGIVPVDKKGEVLHNAIIWSDRRNQEELDIIKSLFTNEQWVEMTGNRPNISFTLGKIMWLKKHHPDVYEKAYKFLLPKDFIRMKLVEVFDTDYSDASATLMMDIKRRNWSTSILSLVDLDAHKLPEIKESTVISGYITEKASLEFGFKIGIPVVCGCGDAQAQAIGNGIVDQNDWLCTIGTSGQLFVSIDKLQIERNGTVHTLEHGTPGKWVMMGATLSAGMSFKWLTESVFNNQYDYPQLLDMASTVKPGSNQLLFLPYLYGERTPHMDEKAKGAFIGLTNEHTHAEMARAVVEGVIFSLYQAYTIVKNTIQSTPNKLSLTGGAAQHPLWLKTAANIFQVPVVKKTSRGGGAYGAAMLAAIGVSDYSSIAELSDIWGLSKEEEVYSPDSSIHPFYEKLFAIYEKSYYSLKEIFQELHDLEG